MDQPNAGKSFKNRARGFTSLDNDRIRNPELSDSLFRFMILMESHLGTKGYAKVKLSTIAKEMGKDRKAAERGFKWFKVNSNLKAKKHGYIYEFYTEPDNSVLYGSTHVSHILPHQYPTTKRSIEKELNKNTKVDLNSNNELQLKEYNSVFTNEDMALIYEIAEWLSRPIFNPLNSSKQNSMAIKGLATKYGIETVYKIYKSVAITGGNPHPSVFWKEINSLKNV